METNIQLKKGLLPHVEDERDLHLGQLINWPKLSDLPEEYLVEPVSIKDQVTDGNDDYCASAAGTGMVEPEEEAELFYPFVFAAAKYEAGGDPDSWGLALRDVGKALQKWGVPEVKDVPDEIKNLPSDKRRRFENYPLAVRESARKHAAKSYFFIKGGPYDHYDNARAAMWYFRDKKQQILTGVNWGWPLTDFELTGIPDGFGHALWKGGWYKDGICLVNSAGRSAGKDGRHSIARESFNKYVELFGMLMVVDLTPEEARLYLETGTKLDRLWLYRKLLLLWVRILAFVLKNPAAKLTDIVPDVPAKKEDAFPPPVPTPEISAPKPMTADMCLAIRDYEGKPGDRNYRNNNPGNCRYSPVGYDAKYGQVRKDKDGFAIFKDYDTGWLYLQNLVRHKIIANPTRTVREFFYDYAPVQDGNDPEKYAAYVAKRLGVGVDFITNNLL